MRLTSNAFKLGEAIPGKYTCDGEDISPPVDWDGVPDGTRSLALTVIDPDAPNGEWVHWLVADLPPDTAGIPEGGPLPEAAREVENDFGRKSYGGPCPPSGTHRYFFHLYALDTERLEADKDNFPAQCKAHSISEAELMGTYSSS